MSQVAEVDMTWIPSDAAMVTLVCQMRVHRPSSLAFAHWALDLVTLRYQPMTVAIPVA